MIFCRRVISPLVKCAFVVNSWHLPSSVNCPRYIDVGSFVDYLLLAVELSNNPDALLASVFLSKEADALGGKLSIGPPWDFNFALGNCVHAYSHVPRGWRFLYKNVVTEVGAALSFGSEHPTRPVNSFFRC